MWLREDTDAKNHSVIQNKICEYAMKAIDDVLKKGYFPPTVKSKLVASFTKMKAQILGKFVLIKNTFKHNFNCKGLLNYYLIV